jgi:hypothetical protein
VPDASLSWRPVDAPHVDSPPTRVPAPAVARRVAMFLAVLAITGAAGWQAGRILQPPLPVPAVSHDHAGLTP